MTSIHNRARALILAFGAALTFAGCGGGEDDSATGTPSGGNAAPLAFAVGGTVSGLVGSGLVLQNNAGDDLAIAADGGFAFSTRLASGTAYAVTVKTQPANPAQTCTVGNGSGTIAAADVHDVSVACTTSTGGGGGGGSGGTSPGYYTGNFLFDGSFDQGRATYVGEAQLRFDFEGDFPNERRYKLATVTGVFTKWEHDGATTFCTLRADSNVPLAFDGFLTFNLANASYALTGGLLVFPATSTCTNKQSGEVSVTPASMQVFVTSADAPAVPGYLPVSGDGAVIAGSRTYVATQNVLTQHNQWRLDRR